MERFPPRCQAIIVLSVEAVMALAPDETLGLVADRIIAEF
jgi:hypothetical protein